jgi:hypothetical protein
MGLTTMQPAFQRAHATNKKVNDQTKKAYDEAVEATFLTIKRTLAAIDIQAAKGHGKSDQVSIQGCAGTAGTFGTAGSCFGTFGSYGSAAI